MVYLGLSLLLIVTLIGPWPINNTHFTDSQYASDTLRALEQTSIETTTGPLLVGVASTDMTPAISVPLAGFSARHPKENTGTLSTLSMKAITFSNQTTTVTIVSGDFLLPLPLLVSQVLAKTHLSRKDIYFASTHTHSGPGGYAMGLVDEMILGEFNDAQLYHMVDKMSQVVIDSRNNLQPATLSYTTLNIPHALASTLVRDQNPDLKAHAKINILQILDKQTPNRTMSLLLSFNAHPTILGHNNDKASADYPGLLQEILERHFHSPAIFMAGAVGGIVPAVKLIGTQSNNTQLDKTQRQLHQITAMAQQLGQLIIDHVGNVPTSSYVKKWQQDTHPKLANIIIPLTLPSPQYIWLEDTLRFSPYLVRALFHDDQTYLHALRIGKIVFLGFPGDVTGYLSKKIEEAYFNSQLFAWVTSFNGDYIGYIVSNDRYQKPHYTTRSANFYGPWLGEYFTAITDVLKHKLSVNTASQWVPNNTETQ